MLFSTLDGINFEGSLREIWKRNNHPSFWTKITRLSWCHRFPFLWRISIDAPLNRTAFSSFLNNMKICCQEIVTLPKNVKRLIEKHNRCLNNIKNNSLKCLDYTSLIVQKAHHCVYLTKTTGKISTIKLTSCWQVVGCQLKIPIIWEHMSFKMPNQGQKPVTAAKKQ